MNEKDGRGKSSQKRKFKEISTSEDDSLSLPPESQATYPRKGSWKGRMNQRSLVTPSLNLEEILTRGKNHLLGKSRIPRPVLYFQG